MIPKTLDVLDQHGGFTIQMFTQKNGHYTLWRPGKVLKRYGTEGRLYSTGPGNWQGNADVTEAIYRVKGYTPAIITWWDNATGERIA